MKSHSRTDRNHPRRRSSSAGIRTIQRDHLRSPQRKHREPEGRHRHGQWVEQNNSSRLGFRGTEDLGGGLKAGFTIEHGLNVDDGKATGGTTFWNRRSEVTWAAARWAPSAWASFFSEAYFATADYVSMHNHDTGTSSDALYAYVANDNNKVAYHSPTLGWRDGWTSRAR